MTFKEIETKYDATDIKLKDFKVLCESLSPKRILQLSSYDYYYTKSKKKFIRYRSGNRPELTIKKKTKASNNYVRVEVNLALDPNEAEDRRLKVVDAFCSGLEFTHNFTIYKTCHIYFYERYNLVYYSVYDENLTEQARLIEIEMDEEFEWPSESAAWSELVEVEKKLKTLGITDRDRISESLYEMFRKN